MFVDKFSPFFGSPLCLMISSVVGKFSGSARILSTWLIFSLPRSSSYKFFKMAAPSHVENIKWRREVLKFFSLSKWRRLVALKIYKRGENFVHMVDILFASLFILICFSKWRPVQYKMAARILVRLLIFSLPRSSS
jgi:hypothetical protein